MSSSEKLNGKRIAFVVTDGFEQVELTGPRDALEEEGAETMPISLRPGTVRGFNHHDPGDEFQVDAVIDSVHPEERLITSRNPDDIPKFSEKIIAAVGASTN